MKYTLSHENYKKFEIFEDNKLKGRAYFIPFKDKEKMLSCDYLTERYNSDMVTVLNGEWDFKYYAKVSDVPEFIDSVGLEFDKITVPSMWQYTGYEEPFYVNQRYQFKPNPPHIPTDIPVGIYRKKFTLTEVSPNEIITFLGVSPCLQLYVNGVYVGYSEGSHNSAEFNLSQYLVEGENELLALVYKYCNGTYIEAQDMFRSNGIFRDVYLTHFGQNYIQDFRIKPKKQDNDYNVKLCAMLIGKPCIVRYTISKGNEIIHTVEKGSEEGVGVILQNALEWSAETPNLYTLILELIEDGQVTQCLKKDFGCRTIKIDKNILYYNGAKIKIKGVNHHDSTEDKGYYMTTQELLKDVQLMKEYNCNAVRTSHYPPDPIFLLMCDHYGLYVIDEADIEAHGVAVPNYYHPNKISHNLAWKKHYWDRVKRMYDRDKNSPSVFMWSLGNEAGGYACQDYCYDELKKLTVSEPIHYEGAIRTKRWAYDVMSTMYYGTAGFEKYLYNRLPAKFYEKPFFQCEYAHAMGVGPGDLDRYWELYYSSDSLLGGCIWEWCDHAVKHENDKYKNKYTYGGDHGEHVHDSNFCVDGLFYPNRTPHTGALCMKNVYRPIRVKRVSDFSFQIINTNAFLDSGYLDIKWDMLENGNVVSSGVIDTIIPPMGSTVVEIEQAMINKGDVFLIFTYTDKVSGREVAVEQVLIREELTKLDIDLGKIKMFDDTNRIGFDFKNGNIIFDKSNGQLVSYNYQKNEFINQKPCREDKKLGLLANIFSAPIDNYMNVKKMWFKQGLDKAVIKFNSINLEHNNITTKHDIFLNNKRAMAYETIYTVYADGSVDVKMSLKNTTLFKTYDLPVIGFSMEIPSEYNSLKYYGLGNFENYSDFNKQSVMGIYSDKVENMLQPYIKPQDSGNRSQIRWFEVCDKKGNGLRVDAIGKAINFNATNVTLDVLKDAKHLEDVKTCEATILNIDGFKRGIGSHSCGQDTREIFRYKLNKYNPFEFSFRFTPIVDRKIEEKIIKEDVKTQKKTAAKKSAK